jgi:hypothetical protein
MRRSRRGGHAGREFGGSGEDSFVAVVVTKLTGALLFILLLTMVIMALLPKVMDAPPRSGTGSEAPALAIKTPQRLPEAIAGRPYTLALAAEGGNGTFRWSIDGKLPEGLALDAEAGVIRGTPDKGTAEPVALGLRVTDGSKTATSTSSLVVYQADTPLTLPSKWDLKLPALPWRVWLEQGFGFLVLFLVYLTGQNTLAGVRRWSVSRMADEAARASALRRHAVYRNLVRVMGASAAAVLAGWLWMNRGA